MKSYKIILTALAIMAGAAFSTVDAKKKDAKKAAPAPVLELKNGSDSVSYAAGFSQTEGLIPFLQNNLKVDTAYMADFIQGMKDALEKGSDPRYKAYQAGEQIAATVSERMYPALRADLKGTPDSLVAEYFQAGFFAALQKDTTKFNMQTSTEFFKSRMEAAKKLRTEMALAEGKAWLEENAKKEGVQTTASGLQYKVITMGTGEKPAATQEVTVKYEGKLIDGTVFDSSYERNPQTSKFKANQVIKGWTEGLQLMPVGSTFEFYVPQELGYGAHAQGKIPAYSTLIFKVELLEVK